MSSMSPMLSETTAVSPVEESANQQVAPNLQEVATQSTLAELLPDASAIQLNTNNKFNQRQLRSLICAISTITLGTTLLFVVHYATFSQTAKHVLFPAGILCQGLGGREIASFVFRTKNQLNADLRYLRELRTQDFERPAPEPGAIHQRLSEKCENLQRELAQTRAANHSLFAKFQRRERLNMTQQSALAQFTQKGADLSRPSSPLLEGPPISDGSSMTSSQGELRPLLHNSLRSDFISKASTSSKNASKHGVKSSKFELEPLHSASSADSSPDCRGHHARAEVQQRSIKDPRGQFKAQTPNSTTSASNSLKTLSAIDRQLLANLAAQSC